MSNSRSEPLNPPTRTQIQWNKIAACIAWAGGTFTTYLFIVAAAPGVNWFIGAMLAVVLQGLLTLGERPLWRKLLGRNGGRLVSLAVVLTLVDGSLNAAGLYRYVGRIAQTDLGRMYAEVLGVQPTMDARSAFVVALLLGLIVAALPEFLWESG